MKIMNVSAGMSAIRQQGKLQVKFNGFHFAKLDHKNRFVLPAPFHRLIGTDRLVMTVMEETERIIVGFEDAQWRENVARLASPALESITAFTFEPKVDNQSRYRIPESLMEIVGLKPKDDLAVVGCGDHLQIWKKSSWLEQIRPK
jgi:DNA-binding transcriptional regulator/RsmH inhibitor MraZ